MMMKNMGLIPNVHQNKNSGEHDNHPQKTEETVSDTPPFQTPVIASVK